MVKQGKLYFTILNYILDYNLHPKIFKFAVNLEENPKFKM